MTLFIIILLEINEHLYNQSSKLKKYFPLLVYTN